jgi:hypothetical protein
MSPPPIDLFGSFPARFNFLRSISICSATHRDVEFVVVVDPNLRFENPRLRQAYNIALQAWKSAIFYCGT